MPDTPQGSAATASALLHEVSEARRLYVDNIVNTKINRRHGECSNAVWDQESGQRRGVVLPLSDLRSDETEAAQSRHYVTGQEANG